MGKIVQIQPRQSGYSSKLRLKEMPVWAGASVVRPSESRAESCGFPHNCLILTLPENWETLMFLTHMIV